ICQPETKRTDRRAPLMRGKWRLLLGLVLVIFACLLFVSSFGRDPQGILAFVNEHWSEIRSWVREYPFLSSFFFFLVYVTFTGLSLPGALFLTVCGGALFDTVWAMCLVSFVSTLGATLAFLSSRYLLRDWVTTQYQNRWQAVRQELEQGGGYYLLAVRLN